MSNIKEKFEYKNFQSHLFEINRLIKLQEPFAFNRISDGELFMMDGLGINLTEYGAKIAGRQVNAQKFAPWDQKIFDPNSDQHIARGLKNALECNIENYIIGLPCPCCCDPQKVTPQSSKNNPKTIPRAQQLVQNDFKTIPITHPPTPCGSKRVDPVTFPLNRI